MNLPRGYKRLDYIESNGTQYIDTLYTPTNTSGFEIVYAPTTVSYTSSFGTYSSNGYWGIAFNSSYIYSYWVGGNALEGISIKRYTAQINYNNNRATIINGIVRQSNIGTTTPLYTATLFAVHGNNTLIEYAYTKLYSFKITENQTIIRHFIPALREADNAIGLYDIINGIFYTNQGTGVFQYGHILQDTITITTNPLIFSPMENSELTANFSITKTSTRKYIIGV